MMTAQEVLPFSIPMNPSASTQRLSVLVNALTVELANRQSLAPAECEALGQLGDELRRLEVRSS